MKRGLIQFPLIFLSLNALNKRSRTGKTSSQAYIFLRSEY